MAVTEVAKTKSIEVTKHAKERWLQRIKGETATDKVLMMMINKMDTQLTLEILQCYENSQFLWTGVLFPNGSGACFSIYDDIIFVANSEKTSIVTCYKVELPFPDQLAKKVIKESVDRIQSLRKQIMKFHDKWIPWFKKKEDERKEIKQKIKDLEERYEEITKEIAKKREFTDERGNEIEEYARIICNSLAFRQEWEKGLLK